MRRRLFVLLMSIAMFWGLNTDAKTFWSSARVSEATVCHGIVQTSRDITPVDPSDRFLRATPELHAVVEYRNVPEDTDVRVAVVYIGGEEPGMAGEALIDVDHVIHKDIKQSYSFDPPYAGWPRGEYALRVFLNDELKHETAFEVYGPDPVPTVIDAVACRGVNPYDMSPIKPTVWFEPDTPEVFISAKIMWALEPVQVTVLWRLIDSDTEPVQDILDYTVEAVGNRRVKFSLSAPDNGWPLGAYEGVLSLNGRQVTTVPFSIALEPTPEALALEAEQASTLSAEMSPVAYMFFIIFWLIWAAFMVFLVITLWKVFEKAGLPGWGVLIPFYNLYLYIKLGGKPGWWLALGLIPFVNLALPVLLILVVLGIARRFGKGTGFGIGLILLPIVFFPILAFGSAQYQPELTEDGNTSSQ